MRVLPLAPQDQVYNMATHKVIVTYADLTAAAATQTIQLLPTGSGTCPAGTTVRFCGMQLTTAFDFSDAGITSLLLEVGDGGDTDRFLTQTEIAVDGTEVLNKASAAASQPYTYPTADGIDALFTAANGGSPLVNEATSGEVEIYLHISAYPHKTL